MKISHPLGVLALLALALASGPARADKTTHERHFAHYEGTKTCLQCHESEAREFHQSQHYQWLGSGESLANAPRHPVGKMNMINDFCTNPDASWIGQVKNADGKVVASGCSGCHAGRGLKPTRKVSREQLENIDCLICHAEGYRRGVVQDAKGAWEWRSILWNNPEGLHSFPRRVLFRSRRRASCVCGATIPQAAARTSSAATWTTRSPSPPAISTCTWAPTAGTWPAPIAMPNARTA